MADKKKDKKKKGAILKPVKFRSIEEVNNTVFTGDEKQDSLILDGVMDFIYGDNVTDADKVSAAKYIATYFGLDPEDITIDYVNQLIKETAAADNPFAKSVKNQMNKSGKSDKPEKGDKKKKGKEDSAEKEEGSEEPKKKKKKNERIPNGGDPTKAFVTSKKWFDGKSENQNVVNLVRSAEKKAAGNLSRYQKDNMKLALDVLSSLEKSTMSKIKINKKDKLKSGGLVINFTSRVFLANMGDDAIRILGLVGNEYELRVGA